jgi:hypothetical protein
MKGCLEFKRLFGNRKRVVIICLLFYFEKASQFFSYFVVTFEKGYAKRRAKYLTKEEPN